MRGLTEGEKERLISLFDRLENDGIQYVVLRKYESLPDRVDKDVDMLIDAADFERATDLALEIGFERAHSGISVSNALSTAIRHPLSATKKGLSLINNASEQPTGEQDTGEYEPIKRKLKYQELDIDAVNHLACPEGSTSSVPQAVEDKMLIRRQRRGEFYVPADVDELAHEVVHCLADYDREFPPYYSAKCEALVKTVSNDAEKRAEFRELMEILFGEIAESVTKQVLSEEFNNLQATVGDGVEERIIQSSRSRVRERAHS